MAKIIAVVVAALLFVAFLVSRMLGVTIDLPVSRETLVVIILVAVVLALSLQGINRPSQMLGPAEDCFSPEMISQIADDDFDMDQYSRIHDHLSQCEKCWNAVRKESERILMDERRFLEEDYPR